jgi:hypothetical protein
MLMPITVLFVMIVALLRGGSLRNFSSLRLRWIPLAIGSFLLQLLIFTPFRETPLVTISTTQIYMLSMALLTLWVAANWRIPGMALMAAGLLANFVAIAANGGYMPVSPAHARIAGTIDRYATEGQAIANNSLATEDDVRLWLLTDILPLPQGFPFANVYSIGDVLLTIGAAILCYRTIRRPRASAPPPAELQGGAAPLAAADLTDRPIAVARRVQTEMATMCDLLEHDIAVVESLSEQVDQIDPPRTTTAQPPTHPSVEKSIPQGVRYDS